MPTHRMALAVLAVFSLAACGPALDDTDDATGENAQGAVAPAATSAESQASPRSTDEDGVARLYLAGDGELWMVDLQGGVRHLKLSELNPGDPPYRIVRRGDRLVAWGYDTYLIDPELESQPTALVRDSWFFIPSAQEDRIWIAFVDPESGDARRLKAVREVTIDGEVTVPDARPPGGAWPERALEAGLVFFDRGEWLVWDPRRDLVRFRLEADGIGPTHGNLIAWCNGMCESVHITDVVTGLRQTVHPPKGFSAFEVWSGAFSPDGSTLALPVRRQLDMGDYDYDLQLALVDVASGNTDVVPDPKVTVGYNFVEWASSGDYVFFTGGQRFEERRIIAYRMGADHARLLPVEVGDFYGAAAF